MKNDVATVARASMGVIRRLESENRKLLAILTNCRPWISRASEHAMTDENQKPLLDLLAQIDAAL